LIPGRIQLRRHRISSSRRRSSCSLTGESSSSKCIGFSLAFARGAFLEGSSGGARGSAA
jgi:hypothetical protein